MRLRRRAGPSVLSPVGPARDTKKPERIRGGLAEPERSPASCLAGNVSAKASRSEERGEQARVRREVEVTKQRAFRSPWSLPLEISFQLSCSHARKFDSTWRRERIEPKALCSPRRRSPFFFPFHLLPSKNAVQYSSKSPLILLERPLLARRHPRLYQIQLKRRVFLALHPHSRTPHPKRHVAHDRERRSDVTLLY